MMTFEQWRKTHDKITLESSPDHFRECCADNNWDAEEVLAVHQYAGGLHYVEELLAVDYCDLKRGTQVFHLMIERREWLVEAKDENKKELEQALFDWAKVECPTALLAPNNCK